MERGDVVVLEVFAPTQAAAAAGLSRRRLPANATPGPRRLPWHSLLAAYEGQPLTKPLPSLALVSLLRSPAAEVAIAKLIADASAPRAPRPEGSAPRPRAPRRDGPAAAGSSDERKPRDARPRRSPREAQPSA